MKRPLLRWFGGKYRIAPWIIENLPKHKIYVEPFGGAASVLLRKPRSYAEVYNDLNDEVYTLFTVLRNHAKAHQLKEMLSMTPYSRREFELAHVYHPDPVEKSRRLIIRSLMGFGSDSASNPEVKTGFRSNTKRSGSTPQHVFVNYYKEFDSFVERLSGVVIENKDAMSLCFEHDSDETLFYLDPPYIQSTRRVGSYSHEMTDNDHVEMLQNIKKLRGKIAISAYEHPLYDEHLTGWIKLQKETMADKAGKRTEVLWIRK